MKNPAAVALGRLGGKAGTGKAKARSSAHAKRAGALGAKARWAKHKHNNAPTPRLKRGQGVKE